VIRRLKAAATSAATSAGHSGGHIGGHIGGYIKLPPFPLVPTLVPLKHHFGPANAPRAIDRQP
jgi:hypothetical protein